METTTSTRAVAGAEAQFIVATADIQYAGKTVFGVPLTEYIINPSPSIGLLGFCVK